MRYVCGVVLGIIVLAYAVWLGWPLLAPLYAGVGAEVASTRARDLILASGPLHSTAWLSAILFYVVAALLTAIGHVRASGAYLFAFMTEIVFRLLLSQLGGAADIDVTVRAEEALRDLGILLSPQPTVLAAVAILGMAVYANEFWPRRPALRRRKPSVVSDMATA